MRSIYRAAMLALAFAGMTATSASAQEMIGGEATNSYGARYQTVTTAVPGSYAPQGEVREYSVLGEKLRSFGQGLLAGPGGIAIDPAGNVWVLDERGTTIGGGRITEFSNTGALLAQVNPAEYTGWSFGLAISGGNLYIADYTGCGIWEDTTTGAFIRAFADCPTSYEHPDLISVNPQTGNLVVRYWSEAHWTYEINYGFRTYQAQWGATRTFTPEGQEVAQ